MKKAKGIEWLWTLTILTAVVISSFYLCLLGAASYRKIIDETEKAEGMRLPIFYLSTAVKQANKSQISIVEQSGALCLKIDYGRYYKLIYEHEGYLKELLVVVGGLFDLNDGEKITEVEALDFSLDTEQVHYVIKVAGKTQTMQLAMR